MMFDDKIVRYRGFLLTVTYTKCNNFCRATGQIDAKTFINERNSTPSSVLSRLKKIVDKDKQLA